MLFRSVTSWKINAFSWNGQWRDHVPCVLNTSQRTVWDSVQENFRKSSGLSSGKELTDFGFVGMTQSFKPCGVHSLQKTITSGVPLKGTPSPIFALKRVPLRVFDQSWNCSRYLLDRSPRYEQNYLKYVHCSSKIALADLAILQGNLECVVNLLLSQGRYFGQQFWWWREVRVCSGHVLLDVEFLLLIKCIFLVMISFSVGPVKSLSFCNMPHPGSSSLWLGQKSKVHSVEGVCYLMQRQWKGFTCSQGYWW